MATTLQRLVLALLGVLVLAASVLLGWAAHLSFLGLAPVGLGLVLCAALGGSLRNVGRALDDDLPLDPGYGVAGPLL